MSQLITAPISAMAFTEWDYDRFAYKPTGEVEYLMHIGPYNATTDKPVNEFYIGFTVSIAGDGKHGLKCAAEETHSISGNISALQLAILTDKAEAAFKTALAKSCSEVGIHAPLCKCRDDQYSLEQIAKDLSDVAGGKHSLTNVS